MVAKVNKIDTTDFVLKSKYQREKTELGKKIPDATDFVKKAKFTELENKSPDISSLATKTVLTAIANKIASVSSLVKKKQTITQKLMKLKRNLLIIFMTSILQLQNIAAIFNARLAQANFIKKTPRF